jgi:hypothetical protein
MSEEEKKRKVKELQVNGGKRTRCTDGPTSNNNTPDQCALQEKLAKISKEKEEQASVHSSIPFSLLYQQKAQAHKDSFAAELKRR